MEVVKARMDVVVLGIGFNMCVKGFILAGMDVVKAGMEVVKTGIDFILAATDFVLGGRDFIIQRDIGNRVGRSGYYLVILQSVTRYAFVLLGC